MKRGLCLFIFAAAFPLLFAADRYICKWCGWSNFGSLQQLIVSPCNRSPTRKHEPYMGEARRFYVCQFCGTESSSLTQLVTTSCTRSPRKYHQAYEGAEKDWYYCKYCGSEFHNYKQLVLSPCKKSPRGYHDAL